MSSIRRAHSSGSLDEHIVSSAPVLPKKSPSRSRSNPVRRPTHRRSTSAQVPEEAQRIRKTFPTPHHVPKGSFPAALPPSTLRGVSTQRDVSLRGCSEPASPARVTAIGRDDSQRADASITPELPEEAAAGLKLADSPPPFGLLPAFSLSPQGEFSASVHRPINELQQSRVIRMRTRASSGTVDWPQTIPARLFDQPPPPVPPVPPPSPLRAQRIVTTLRRRPSVRNEPIRKGETLLAGALQDSRSLCTAADATAGVSPDKSQAVRNEDERPGCAAEAESTDFNEHTQHTSDIRAEPQETGARTDERFSAVMREWQSAFGAFVPENTIQSSEGTAAVVGLDSVAASEQQPHHALATAPEQLSVRSSPASAGPPTVTEPPATGALTEPSSIAEAPVSVSMCSQTGCGGRDATAESISPPLVTPPTPFTPSAMTAQRAQAPGELHESQKSPPQSHAPTPWLFSDPEKEGEAAKHVAVPRTPRRKKSKMSLFLKEALFPRQAKSDMPMTAKATETERYASPEGHEHRQHSLERRASTLSLCSTLSGTRLCVSTRMLDSPTLGICGAHSAVDAINPRSFSTSDYVSNVPVLAPTSPAAVGPASNAHEASQVPVSAGGDAENTQSSRWAVRGLGRRIASSLSLSSITQNDVAHYLGATPRSGTAPRRREGSAANFAVPSPPVRSPPTFMPQSAMNHPTTFLPSLLRSEQSRGPRAAETPVRPPGLRSELEQPAGASPHGRRWGIPFSLPSRLLSTDTPQIQARAASHTIGTGRNNRMPATARRSEHPHGAPIQVLKTHEQ